MIFKDMILDKITQEMSTNIEEKKKKDYVHQYIHVSVFAHLECGAPFTKWESI